MMTQFRLENPVDISWHIVLAPDGEDIWQLLSHFLRVWWLAPAWLVFNIFVIFCEYLSLN